MNLISKICFDKKNGQIKMIGRESPPISANLTNK